MLQLRNVILATRNEKKLLSGKQILIVVVLNFLFYEIKNLIGR